MAIIHLAFVQRTLTGAFVKYVSFGNAAMAVTRVASRRKPFPAPFYKMASKPPNTDKYNPWTQTRSTLDLRKERTNDMRQLK